MTQEWHPYKNAESSDGIRNQLQVDISLAFHFPSLTQQQNSVLHKKT